MAIDETVLTEGLMRKSCLPIRLSPMTHYM